MEAEMKITLLLKNDHDLLRGLIEKFMKSPMRNQERMTLFQKIRNSLQIHSQIASELLYSALAATPSDRAVELADTNQKRCDAVERLFKELGAMSPSDPDFEIRMNALIAEIGMHIEMEEDEVFHEARKMLPEYQLEELGLEMQSRRDALKRLAVV
jgi:hypothetical protein